MRRLLASRRRILLTFLGILVILDVGRSIYARVGYEQPTEIWQPNPKVYAALTWPPGADLPQDSPVGLRVYAKHCAVCHGPDGRGNGPAAPSLIPHPRDFTQGQYKYKSTASGKPPTDEDLIRTVSGGLQASAMPYWNDLLSESEIREVVTYIKNLSPVFSSPAPQVLAIPARAPSNVASIDRGRNLFQTQGCADCHGPDGRGGRWLKDAHSYPVVSRDLTAPWTFRGGSDPEQIWLRITTGLAPSPMPAYGDKMTPRDRWDLVNYMLSRARIPPWESGGKLEGPGHDPDPLKRGRYLVHAEMCSLCHTQTDRTGIYRVDDYYLAGGMRVDVYPHGKLVSRNLTSDPETGLGNWTEEEIVNAFQNGRAPDRVLNALDMPWHWFHAFSEEDAFAIARYLKTLPPVRNWIPPALRYGVVETVAIKLTRSAPAYPPEVLGFVGANFGQATENIPRDLLQRVLVNAQWLVLLIGVLAFLLGGPRERRWPRGTRGWTLTVLGTAGALLLTVGGWAVYHLPALSSFPQETFANVFLHQIHRPDAETLSGPEHLALVARGRLIFTVASCAICHRADGSGGLKISWKGFGTLWTRNITSDKTTGIGAWSDAEIARAIRSGVTPDGRMFHWQGMIWDHASNWDEEDIRALVAYLRTLPPVNQEIPPARPPAEDDCDRYVFWISESWTPGCE